MKIVLVAMSGVRVRTAELAALGVTLPGFVQRGEVIASLPSLGLVTLAGMIPSEHEVEYIEIDQLPDLATLPRADLVAISSLTAVIDAAYEVADHYRDCSATVVMGGLHVSVLPEEALQHCDAVVVGGAERVWPAVIADVQNDCLRRIYHGADEAVFTPDSYVVPRFELLSGRPYNRLTIQTSRGCPRRCEFCAASLLITKRFNQKPVDLVVAELRAVQQHFRKPFFEFADDNTFLDKRWGREFLRALIPEEIKWFTETDASVADDSELCDLLSESGCRQLLIGFESPQAPDLRGVDPVNWKQQVAPRIRAVVEALQSRGVSVNGCFIVGLDAHTPDVFPALRDFVRASGLAEVQITVQTPFPGTPLYARLHESKRLLAERFWDRCTLFDVNFKPAHMSVAELEQGLRWLFTELYSQKETDHRRRNFINMRRSS